MFHDSWPPAAQHVILRAIDRHGGMAAWSRLGSVTAQLCSIDGFLLRAKGARSWFRTPRAITVDPKADRTELADYPERGMTGVYDAGHVRIETENRIASEGRDHRRSFASPRRKLARWTPLDALYFFGYAFVSYLKFPFVFPRLRFVRAFSVHRHGAWLDAVVVQFPIDAHVHSRVQTFYFDRSGLIRRNDYVAEVAGPWWRGAHSWDEPAFVDGLVLPTHRRIVPRLGRWRIPFPLAVHVTFADFAVHAIRESSNGPSE